jgi:hypothetical protein
MLSVMEELECFQSDAGKVALSDAQAIGGRH